LALNPLIFHIGNQDHIKSDWKLWSKFGKNTIHGDMMLSKDFKEFIGLLNEHNVPFSGRRLHRLSRMKKR